MRILHKSKRSSPPHPQVAALISSLLGTRNEDLVQTLSEIDAWKWPRSDLNAWLKVLNKFDAILEDIVTEYKLNDLQLEPFSPQSKELLCEILRFERLLLENSTNRKLFSSYDRLNSLLCTEDLDVLVLALNLLLRPAQQYSNQPSVTQALNISTSRLQSLTKRWPQLRDHGVSLANLARPSGSSVVDALQPEARQVNFSFYRMGSAATTDQDSKNMDTDVTESHPRNVSNGPVSIQIDERTLAVKPVMHILKDAMEAYSVPDKEKFDLMCRIRAAKVLLKGNEVEREKYVIVRLLAIAIFGHTHLEPQAQSSLFLYEPDVINHVAELLQADSNVSIPVQTAAIAALDALARYRSKTQEILSAVNAGVNHGILMALVRKTVVEVANPDSTIPHSYVEALLSFITYIATHVAGGNMVVGAGLVPLLIQVIDNKLPNRLPMVSKAMQLVDNVLYNFANAFQVFCAARGVEVLVNRIEYEINFDLDSCGERPGARDLAGCGDLPVARAAILKHTLRSLHRMMQSSGTAEGLRGLIDSSILKSIKKVIEYRGLFGPSVLPLAINIMSTFIHNEPTSLPTIQESELPETFYRAIEGGLEPAIEVIQAIPNAIGALCLNEAGQKQLSNRPSIIPTIFAIFTSEHHLKVLLDKENAVLMGTAIDELIRHHPSLKGIIFDSMKAVMTKIEDMGNAWKPEGDTYKWYALSPRKDAEGEEIAMVEGEPEPLNIAAGVQDVNMDDSCEDSNATHAIIEEPPEDKSEGDDSLRGSHDNRIVSFIDAINRFLEGLFQHTPHCKDFVAIGGLGPLGRFSSLPCLPYDFGSSVASDSMVQVMRTLAEICTSETVQHLLMLVRSSLDETKEFWAAVGGESKFLSLLDFPTSQVEVKNKEFRKFITLHIRITLLSDVFATASYAHGRAAIALLQTLMGEQGPQILPDLGALHRAALCENLLFKTALGAQGIVIAATPISSPWSGSPVHGDTSLPPADGATAANGISSPATNNITSADATSSSKPLSKCDDFLQQNASTLKHLSHGLPASLAPFFQALVKTFYSRRNPDPAQKKQIAQASKLLGDVLLQHISQSDIGNKSTLYSYFSLVFGLITSLLIDERTTTVSLHTVSLYAFYNVGGFEAISTACQELMSSIATITTILPEDRTEDQKQEFLHAQGALKIALHLLHPVISKHLLESGQNLLLTTVDKKDTDPGYFEPHNFLVRLRLSVVRLLSSLWEAEWLLQAPLPITKSVVQTVLEIVNAENEESKRDPISEGHLAQIGIPRPSPDENRIRQLTDMGFPRSSAERALLRTHNNLSAATELLLAHPILPEPISVEAEPLAQGDAIVEDDMSPDSNTSDETQQPDGPSPTSGASEQLDAAPDTPPAKSAEQWRQELEEARLPLREGLTARALNIVDKHPQLVFDLHVAFVRPQNEKQKEAVGSLVDDISTFSPSAYEVREQSLANRCQLLAWVMLDSPNSLSPELRKSLLEKLLALLLSTPAGVPSEQPVLPKWLAALLLCVEALLTLAEEPRTFSLPKKDEPIIPEELFQGPPLEEARNVVFDFCLRLLAAPTLPTNELISTLRILVGLTRSCEMASLFVKRGGVDSLLSRLKTGIEQSCASYVAIILRHTIEDAVTVKHITQQSIKQYFSQSRSPFSDVNSFLRHCNAMALRDPKIFIESTTNLCVLSHPYTTSLHIALKSKNASEKTPPGPDSEEVDGSTMQVDPPFQPAALSSRANESAEAVVHTITAELLRTGRAATSQAESAIPSEPNATLPTRDASSTDKQPEHHHYQCFLMQCLTELLFSYETCKVFFLSYSPKKRTSTPAKESAKFRTGAIHFLLSELISSSTLNTQPAEDDQKRVSNWAMSVIVALCVDTSPTSYDAKDISPDLVSVRKFVLEALNRAIKDSPPAESTEARYGRLLALADLCFRLLTVKFNSNPRRQSDETSTHIAKIMLEKNFVATLTNSLSEVDLNYPNVRSLVAAMLKPLEVLTKTAIKMSRTSSKAKGSSDGRVSDNESYTSEEGDDAEDDGPREETPDLYRNSALGMYGGEMEDVNFNEDDDMDDDEDDEDEDIEMEYQDDTGSEDTSNTDDEEEDELDNDTHESGEAWGDDDDDDGLIENDGDNEDEGGDNDDDDDGEDEDEDEDEDHIDHDNIWPNQTGTSAEVGEDVDDDDDDERGVPIPILHEQEDGQDPLSDDGDFDELAVIHHGGGGEYHQDIFNILDAPGSRDDTLITGRRMRDVGVSLMFGRAPSGQPAPLEHTTHPLLMDTSNPLSNRITSGHSRSGRQHQRVFASGPGTGDLFEAFAGLVDNNTIQLLHQLMPHSRGTMGTEEIRLDVPPGMFINLDRSNALNGRRPPFNIRIERHPRQPDPRPRGPVIQPLLTVQRWAEEAKVIHGDFVSERVGKLVNHVVLALLPAAVEAAKQAKIKEDEARAKAESELKKLQEAEEKAKQDAEEKARIEDEEKARLDAEDTSRKHVESDVAPSDPSRDDAEPPVSVRADLADMEMSDQPEAEEAGPVTIDEAPSVEQPPPADAASSSATQRVTVMIHGSAVDITDTGIDPTFLEALPDDMREEVINQHVRDQRAARVERPPDSQISVEFLDALPPEIRAEIIQQEQLEQARRRTDASAPTRGAAEIDAASFIASLDPQLRQDVLLDSDEGFLSTLPSHMLAEAGAYREVRNLSHRHGSTRPASNRLDVAGVIAQRKSPANHDAIQLLDKTGLAGLVRLLFFPQVLKKNLLPKVLVNLCENAKTRTDLFNLLLSILQDGTVDLSAVDKSFAQMSVKSTKSPTPKAAGKQRHGSDLLSSLTLSNPQSDPAPELIAQRCLECLTFIVSANELSSVFFLTENELPVTLRKASSRKGKGKEKLTSPTHYPIVLLLGLLDRQSLLKTPSIMESVVSLLATVTRPLTGLKDVKPAPGPSAATIDTSPVSDAPVVEAPLPETTVQASESAAIATPDLPAVPVPTTENIQSKNQPEEKLLLAKPPSIPHTVLRLIVNILTIGECSGRTFQHSLTLIQNLSHIPDARDVIAQELKAKAQEFGHNLLSDLDGLASSLASASSDIQTNPVASKFSASSSTQANLLRVLKTIDYMYAPKSSAEAQPNADAEKVQAIYESFNFSPLWQRLSDCLRIIEEKPETEHIATVLLPLIEALMVVCKHVGPSATSSRRAAASISPKSPTVSKESVEDLFVTFTDAHRKLLNVMVRNNPSLMSGSFSLLVHNPRVLDFDNKRNYFTQQLHRRPHAREHHGTLQLNVRRARVFEDSFQHLQRKTGDQVKYGKLSVRFYDEEGVDAGGVTREWFQILARQMFDPNNALFQPCAADRLTYQPNKNSWVNPEHLSFFKFVGRVIGKAIYDGRLLDAYFARSLYRQILGKPVDYRDVEWVDPEYYNSLCWILENDPTLLELTFSVEADEFGINRIIPLKEGGEGISVTLDNRREFVQLSAQYRLYSSIKDQIENLLAGFYEIIPKDLITIFNEQELELLISGTPDIAVDEWRAATEYSGYNSSDPVIVWWWRALKSFNREERAKVLSFATGTSRVPLGGFVELQGVQGTQRFSIHRAYGEPDRLPQAHTCFNQVDLPQYSSYEMLRQQLLLAITEGGEGFAFA